MCNVLVFWAIFLILYSVPFILILYGIYSGASLDSVVNCLLLLAISFIQWVVLLKIIFVIFGAIVVMFLCPKFLKNIIKYNTLNFAILFIIDFFIIKKYIGFTIPICINDMIINSIFSLSGLYFPLWVLFGFKNIFFVIKKLSSNQKSIRIIIGRFFKYKWYCIKISFLRFWLEMFKLDNYYYVFLFVIIAFLLIVICLKYLRMLYLHN